MVRIESASTVGIPSSIGSAGSPRSGIVVHYPGSPVLNLSTHDKCRNAVRNWHRMHINSNGWAGIGYHYLICPHGIVLTGRGLNRVGAHAPGANATHVGVQIMVANSQDANAAQLQAFREFRDWLRARGVNANNITPHSRWISTSCPGDHLRRRISRNDWGSGSSGGSAPSVPSDAYWSVGAYKVPTGDPLLSKNSYGSLVKYLQQCLMAWRSNILPKWKDDSDYGDETVAGVKTFQKAHNLDDDGVYGTNTASKMREVITGLVGPEGILGMSSIRSFNDNAYEQVLPHGEWQEVRFEEDTYSLAMQGELFMASIGLTVEGLNKGDEFQFRFTEVKENPESSGPKYVRARSLPIDSPVHDAGYLHVTGSWGGKLPNDRRLRLEAVHYSDSEEVKIIRRTASVLYSK